jgi:putative SOS response-associated peptidase YedK
MCGRFAMTLPVEAMAQLFQAAPDNDLPPNDRYNICPTQQITAVVSTNGSRRLRAFRWGFIPHWYKTPTDGPLLINARAETIAQKPAFGAACRSRRCIIPATGFYEWTKTQTGARQPWYVHPAKGTPIAFAAIWQDWGAGPVGMTTCAIVTCAANKTMSGLHSRMPVTLAPEAFGLWLGETGKGAARLMHAAPEAYFTFHKVAPEVNSNRASGPALIEPRLSD